MREFVPRLRAADACPPRVGSSRVERPAGWPPSARAGPRPRAAVVSGPAHERWTTTAYGPCQVELVSRHMQRLGAHARRAPRPRGSGATLRRQVRLTACGTPAADRHRDQSSMSLLACPSAAARAGAGRQPGDWCCSHVIMRERSGARVRRPGHTGDAGHGSAALRAGASAEVARPAAAATDRRRSLAVGSRPTLSMARTQRVTVRPDQRGGRPGSTWKRAGRSPASSRPEATAQRP